MDQDEAPKYRVKELSLIGNELFQPGAVVDTYTGLPSGNLEPLNAAAEARFKDAADAEGARVAALEKQYGDKSVLGSPEAFAAAVAKAVAEGMKEQKEATEALQAKLAELEARFTKTEESLG